MANSTTNTFDPWYSKMMPLWEKMRDTMQSEEHMKQKAWCQCNGFINSNCTLPNSRVLKTFNQYLRPTEGMITSSVGALRYSNYMYRAKWYPYALDTHDQALGMINNQPPVIELTTNLEYLKQDATNSQESLECVLNEINSQQLIVSRVGLLGETTADPLKSFNIAFYNAETITEWRVNIAPNGEELLTWVKLLTDFCDNDNKPIYLILMLDDNGNYIQYKTTDKTAKPEIWGVMDPGYIEESFIMPEVRESSTSIIPFVVVNLSRLGVKNIQKPYLESISDAAIKLFQASATYEDTLYWGAQSTFWATGVDKKEADGIILGNGGRTWSTSPEAKFGYASAGTDGIEPNKTNVDELKKDCVALGVDLINQGVESGVALDTRMNVKTASLKTLAKTGANGLQRLLRIMAAWVGDKVEDVIVIANTDFADRLYTADDFQKFGALTNMGQMRQEDLYNLQKMQGLTTAETFDDWNIGIETEDMTGTIL